MKEIVVAKEGTIGLDLDGKLMYCGSDGGLKVIVETKNINYDETDKLLKEKLPIEDNIHKVDCPPICVE